MGAHSTAFAADTEKFGFDGVSFVLLGNGLFKAFIKGIHQSFPCGITVCRGIFVPVRRPEVADTGTAQLFTENFTDAAAGDTVVDPKL